MDNKKGKIIAISVSLLIIMIIACSGIYLLRVLIQKGNNQAQPEVVPGRLFYSNFHDKKVMKSFEKIDSKNAQGAPSKWEIADGLIQKSNIFSQNQINPGSFLIIQNGFDWQNFQADVKFNVEADGIFGFLVRYQDENNFYKVHLTCNHSLGGPIIKIDKIKDGKLSTLYQKNQCFQLKSENTVRLVVNGNRIDVFLNSEQVTIYGLDNGALIDKGTFGFFVSSMPNLKINYLEIQKITNNTESSGTGQVLSEKSEEQKLDEKINELLKEIGSDFF